MASKKLVALLLLASTCYASQPSVGDVETIDEQGYYKREHSLVQPYHGNGMDIPFWSFGGNTVVTSNYVRLTPDRQSKKGSIWNTYPTRMHNWEMVLHFQVHGQAKSLFGDGFAVWYTKEHGEMGSVFGNRDYFTGMAVFFDTYSNHNGEHSHEHPYISAMVNNGSIHYDHDRDGTHSQVSGCTCYFRNSKQDTFVMISYINRQVVVMTNIGDSEEWKLCFSTEDVDLPTGYYFGVTAATGDLADNHDVISLKVYDVDGPPEEVPSVAAETVLPTIDWSKILPKAANAEAPRAHIEDAEAVISPRTYKVMSYGLVILLVVGLVVVVGGIAFIKNQEKTRKRFF